jgi:hypothetical protein
MYCYCTYMLLLCTDRRQARSVAIDFFYSTTASAPVKAGAASQCPAAAATVTSMDSSRWNCVCRAMNASTCRWNTSASSRPQQHASASRAVADDRPLSDSQRRSSGDAARRGRGPIFSDRIRRGARAGAGCCCLFSSNAGTTRGGASRTRTASSMAGGGVAKVVVAAAPSEEEVSSVVAVVVGAAKEATRPALLSSAEAACSCAVVVDEDCSSPEGGRSCLESAKRRSTMAFPSTNTKRAFRSRDPASRSAVEATSARSSPARSRSAAPPAMPVWLW